MKKIEEQFKVGKLYVLKADSAYSKQNLEITMYLHDEEIIRKGFPDGKSGARSCHIMIEEHPILVLVTNYDSLYDIGFCKIITGDHIGWVNLTNPGLESFLELMERIQLLLIDCPLSLLTRASDPVQSTGI